MRVFFCTDTIQRQTQKMKTLRQTSVVTKMSSINGSTVSESVFSRDFEGLWNILSIPGIMIFATIFTTAIYALMKKFKLENLIICYYGMKTDESPLLPTITGTVGNYSNIVSD